MNEVIKKLNYHFYGSIIVLVVFLALVLIGTISFVVDAQVGIVAERYSIGLTLLVIPIALKLFSNMVNKEENNVTPEKSIQTYRKASLIRLYLINVMIFANIIFYAMSSNQNFVWLAVVLFVSFSFCRPSYVELEELTTPKEEEAEYE